MARTLPNNLTPPRFISAVKVQRHRLMWRSVCAWQVRTMREAILLICFSQQKWVRTCRWYSETVELAVHDVSDGESRPCCVVDKPRSHLVSLHLAGYIERDIYALAHIMVPWYASTWARCSRNWIDGEAGLGRLDATNSETAQPHKYKCKGSNGTAAPHDVNARARCNLPWLLQATNKCMQVPCFVSWPDGPTQMRNS
jgi:hypothetical protein